VRCKLLFSGSFDRAARLVLLGTFFFRAVRQVLAKALFHFPPAAWPARNVTRLFVLDWPFRRARFPDRFWFHLHAAPDLSLLLSVKPKKPSPPIEC